MYNKHKLNKLKNSNYIYRLSQNRKGRKKLGNLINSATAKKCANYECSYTLIGKFSESYNCKDCLLNQCYTNNNELLLYPEKFE